MDYDPPKYDYLSAGFDNFLSRSIDGLTQFNLSSQGPVSNQIRFDAGQVSGAMGDVIKFGNILIDGANGRILFYDGEVPVGIVGFDQDGF